LVSRNDGTPIVGSIAQPGNSGLDITESSPEVEMMWKARPSFLLYVTLALSHITICSVFVAFYEENVKVRADA
jgi:hypothetical protein